MKIVFAGTPVFAQIQLQALINAKHDIVAVYTQPDKPAGRGQHMHASPVKELALQHQIPVEQPTSLKTFDAQATLAGYKADVMIVAAYGLILPKAILALPQWGCINVHASLLPRWRGASPIQQAILSGDLQTGITLMRMDVGLDTGDILAQKACAITPVETTGSLHDKLAMLGAEFLVEQLDNITKSPHPIAQDPQKVTHASKITKEQALIDWFTPGEEIERKIRAFNPWPIAYTMIDSQILRIWQAQLIQVGDFHHFPPGQIIDHAPTGLVVTTKSYPLLLTTGQLPGKKPMPLHEIINGHHELFAVGKKLG